MISQKQLKEWQIQNLKDQNQFKKDEELMKSMQGNTKTQVSSFFERMRARFFHYKNEDHDKLNRLLNYTQIYQDISKYPKINQTYLTYNVTSIILLGFCLWAPKKIVNKIIASLITYGFKTNIGDGLLTYYIVENLALSTNMTQKQQQVRNILQFYCYFKLFHQSIKSQQQKKQLSETLQNIKIMNGKYKKFKELQTLF